MTERPAHPARIGMSYLAIVALASLVSTAGSVGAEVTNQSTVVGNQLSITAPGIPAVEAELPVLGPDAPEPEHDESAAGTDVPTTKPEIPEAEPEEPGSEPEVPGSEPEVPVTEPEAPVEDPEAPTETPEAPTETPETPTETPEAPSEEPEAPSEEPEAPAAAVVTVSGAPLTIEIEPGAESGHEGIATTEFELTNSGGRDATVMIKKAHGLLLNTVDPSDTTSSAQLGVRLATGATVFSQQLAGPGSTDEPTGVPITVPANSSIIVESFLRISDTAAFQPARLTFQLLLDSAPTTN